MHELRFEERQLKPYVEAISASDLKVGEVYFSIVYFDRPGHFPVVETLVFIGRDLDPESPGLNQFQTIESHHQGIR